MFAAPPLRRLGGSCIADCDACKVAVDALSVSGRSRRPCNGNASRESALFGEAPWYKRPLLNKSLFAAQFDNNTKMLRAIKTKVATGANCRPPRGNIIASRAREPIPSDRYSYVTDLLRLPSS